jgi:hypothetical protein
MPATVETPLSRISIVVINLLFGVASNTDKVYTVPVTFFVGDVVSQMTLVTWL